MQTYSSLFCCNWSNCLGKKPSPPILLQAAEHCGMQYAQFQLNLYPHDDVLKHAMSGWTLMKVTWSFLPLYTQNTVFRRLEITLFISESSNWTYWWFMSLENGGMKSATSFLLYTFRTKPTTGISIKNYYHHLKQLKQKKLAETKVPAQLPWPHFSPVRVGICILKVT